jgi:SPP1 family predicted phage head-tail adaptor
MIADLKHRVTIQQPVLTPDGAGGFAESWQNIPAAPDVYAAITPVNSGEQLKFGQLEATATHRIIIRYRTDITPSMRLVDTDGTVYTLNSVADQAGLKRYLVLAATVRSS